MSLLCGREMSKIMSVSRARGLNQSRIHVVDVIMRGNEDSERAYKFLEINETLYVLEKIKEILLFFGQEFALHRFDGGLKTEKKLHAANFLLDGGFLRH